MAILNTTDRLASLRKLMKDRAIDMYIVPSEDAHQSEFVAACDARRAFLSGFTGSAGTAVVTPDKAILATDGRYFAQAEKQLDANWELLKQGMPDVPYWRDWVGDNADGGKTVAIDPAVITATEARKLSEKIVKKGGQPLKSVAENLVDLVWAAEKPGRPNEKIKVLDVKYAGKKFEDKLEDLRKELDKKKSEGIVLSMLDEIAWLFNLRGSDIDYNPVFFSYAIVTPKDATLYVDESKVTPEVKAHLGSAVAIKPYAAIFADMPAMQAHLQSVNDGARGPRRRYILGTKSSWALSVGLGGEDCAEEMRSPVGDAKAIKNEAEMAGMRACHVRDGAALIEFFAWLEDRLGKGDAINEIQAADKLEQIRSKHDLFVGLSFDTISSAGPNAAIIHYKPLPDTCAPVTRDVIYLCDSGAQYLDGTTDTTRTLHFGAPTAGEREAFTLVLKGNIALERAIFPKRTTGLALDALARQFLWAKGRDYSHGTGHGVGSFLNVHEGPVGIGTRREYADVALSVGNVLSNEPGYYEDGAFGIRIENMMMVVEAKTEHGGGDRPFFGFEHVTMVPMCRKLIDVALLDEGEKRFLNEFHAEVFEKTKGFFEADELTMAWLKRETAPY